MLHAIPPARVPQLGPRRLDQLRVDVDAQEARGLEVLENLPGDLGL
jgi:hypothetical protein